MFHVADGQLADEHIPWQHGLTRKRTPSERWLDACIILRK